MGEGVVDLKDVKLNELASWKDGADTRVWAFMKSISDEPDNLTVDDLVDTVMNEFTKDDPAFKQAFIKFLDKEEFIDGANGKSGEELFEEFLDPEDGIGGMREMLKHMLTIPDGIVVEG